MSEQGKNNDGFRKSQDLGVRLASYAGRVVAMISDLPDTIEGRHLRDQLLRSATAPGAHYAEARSAQTRDDFIYKLSLAAKEARESNYWLRVIVEAGLGDTEATAISREANELVAILFQSLQTARANRNGN